MEGVGGEDEASRRNSAVFVVCAASVALADAAAGGGPFAISAGLRLKVTDAHLRQVVLGLP